MKSEFGLLTWHCSWYSQGTGKGTNAMSVLPFLFFSTAGAALESVPGPHQGLSVRYVPITETHYTEETNNC